LGYSYAARSLLDPLISLTFDFAGVPVRAIRTQFEQRDS
jgi:hypothetical protein